MKAHDADPADGAARDALGADLVIPALAALFAFYFFWDTWRLDWEARINGFLIGIPLLVLVAVKAASVLVRVGRGGATLGLGTLVRWDDNQRRRLTLLAILVGLALTLPALGVTLGLFLALVLSMLTLGVRSVPVLALVPTVASGTVYLLFIVLLHKRMPYGPIENGLALLFQGAS